MEQFVNQAVLFTKPLHHLGLALTPEQLDEATRGFFGSRGFVSVESRSLSGSDLSGRDAIRQKPIPSASFVL